MIRRTCGEVITATVDAKLMGLSPTLPFVTEAAYAALGGAARYELFAAERVEAGPPAIVPASDFYDPSPLAYDFPAVTLTTLRDVVVRGRANILAAPDAVVRHDLVDRRTDETPEEFYNRLTVSADDSLATWAAGDPFEVGYVPEAAVFTDGTAFNYAHWMTEVLPRLAAFVRDPARRAVPLLIDSELHGNLVRSIQLVAGPDVVLHRLTPDAAVRVGVLHNVSPTGYAPFKLRRDGPADFSHGLFGSAALRATIGRLRAAAPAARRGEARPKVFIRRKTAVRSLVNEQEIEDALLRAGFTAIAPERLSLEEQIAVYSNAAMVVGATGAAITNLLFCAPDCPVVVLMPQFRLTAYWYWRRMAAAAGAGTVVHAVGKQIQTLDDPYHPLALHQDFRVEVHDVLAAVETADALRR